MSHTQEVLEMLLDERIQCALEKLQKTSPEYQAASNRAFYLNDALQQLLSQENTPCTSCDKEMVQEYLRLTDDMRLQEKYTIYIQGFLDCITSLFQTGWFPS